MLNGRIDTDASSGTLVLNTDQGANTIGATGVLGTAGQPGTFTTLGTITAQLLTNTGATVNMNVSNFRIGGESRFNGTTFNGTVTIADFGGFGTWRGLRVISNTFNGVVDITNSITAAGGSGNTFGFSGNTFNADATITCNATQTGVSIGDANTWFPAAASPREVFNANLTLNISTTATRAITIDGGATTTTVAGNLTVNCNGGFGEVHINNLSVTGASAFNLINLTTGEGVQIARYSGRAATFNGNVTINNTGSTVNEIFRCANLGNVTFNGNITVSSTGGASGSRRIRLADNETTAGTVTLAANRTITATGVQVGELHIQKITQASGTNTHTHDLSTGSAVQLFVRRNPSLQGNMTATGDRMEFRRNVIGSSAANTHVLSHIATANGSSNGGNTFNGNTTLSSVNHTANIDWTWGWNDGSNNGGADIFNGNLTVTTGNERTTTLAHSTSGNQVNGNLSMSTANGTSRIASGASAELTVTGTSAFTVTGSRTTDTWRQGVTISDNASSSVNLQGNVSIVQSGAGPVRFYHTGTVSFGGDVAISATGGGEVNFGQDVGTATLAAGKILDASASTTANINIRNLVQTAGVSTHTHNFSTTATTGLRIVNNTLHGNLTATGNRMRIRGNTLGSNSSNVLSFTLTGINPEPSGGNTFNGATTFTHTTAAEWNCSGHSGGGADTFNADATFVNNSTSSLVIARNTLNNTFNGSTTFRNNTGTLFLTADISLYNATPTVSATFNGPVTFENNSAGGSPSGRPSAITVGRNGAARITFNNNVGFANTASSGNEGNIAVGTYGGVTFNGNISINRTGTSSAFSTNDHFEQDGRIVFTGTSDQTITSNQEVIFRYLEVNKTAGTKLILGSNTLLSRSTNSPIVSPELVLTSGLIELGPYDLTLTHNATWPSVLTGGSATSYAIATGTGRLFRRVEAVNVLFPVGTASAYMPFTINNAGTADQFGVRMADLSAAPYSISSYFTNNGWDVAEGTAGGSNSTITGQWNAGNEQTNFNRAQSAFYRWNGTQFNCLQAEAAAGGAGPYTRSVAALGATNSVGVFAPATAFADAYTGDPNVMNQTSCGGFNLAANVNPFTGPGAWSVVSQPGGSPVVTFADAASPTSLVSGLVTGAYVLRWTTASGCTNRTSDVTVNFTQTSLVPVANCVWTGDANNGNWADCTNWTGSVPGEVTPGVWSNVTIPGGLTTMYPVLTANVTVGGFTMTAGASINFANFTLEARGATSVAGSTLTSNGGILNKVGTSDDTWAGGNTFSGNLTIRHSGAGGTLTLASTTGNTFNSTATAGIANHTYTFDIANAAANMVLGTTAVTSTFIGNAVFASLRDADFQAGNLSLTTNTHSTLRSTGLQAGRRAIIHNYTINRAGTFTLTFYGLHTVSNTMTLTSGRTLLADGTNLLLDNTSPSAIVGVAGPTHDEREIAPGDINNQTASLAGTGRFSWRCAPNASAYVFPVGFGGWNPGNSRWGRMSAFGFTMQAGTDIITVHAVGYATPAANYSLTNVRSGSINNQYVNWQWIATCADPASTLQISNVTLPWRQYGPFDEFEQPSFVPARNRSAIVRYHHSAGRWECIMPTGTPVTFMADRYSHTATGAYTKTSDNNLGVFGIASVTADPIPTATVQNTSCRIISLDADDNMVASGTSTVVHPTGGQWVFISGPSTPTILNPTNPLTTAVGATADGNYVFEWRRFSTECGGTLAAPIHAAQVTIAVTEAPPVIPAATTWTGAVSSVWGNCANWSDGVPGTTTFVTLPATASNWPVLSADVTLQRLIALPGSEINLATFTLETRNIPTTTNWWDFDTELLGATIRSANNATIEAKVKARYLQVRKSTFTGKIELAVEEPNTTHTRARNLENGGNTFQQDVRLSLAGRSGSSWGWNNAGNDGGPDTFLQNVEVMVEDLLTPAGPGTRPTGFQTTYDVSTTTYPNSYSTAFPTSVNYISTPYYVFGSAPATYTGTKVGFAAYPRPTDQPTNTTDPGLNAANALANEGNHTLNMADEEQSRQNIEEARLNAISARDNASTALNNLNNAIATGSGILTQVAGMAAYTGNEGTVVARWNDLQTAINNGNTQVALLTTARDNASTAAADLTNAPGADNTAANAAHTQANTGHNRVISIYNAINALHTALNAANTTFNTANATAVNNGNDTGFIRIAENTTGNTIAGNLTVRTGPAVPDNTVTAPGGRVFLSRSATGSLVVSGNLTALNHGRGGWEAISMAQDAGAVFTVTGTTDILNKGAGLIWAGRDGVTTFTGNLRFASSSGSINFGVNSASSATAAQAGFGIHPDGFTGGTITTSNFTHAAGGAVSIAMSGTAVFQAENGSVFNSPMNFINSSSGDVWGGATYFAHRTGHTVTFNGPVLMRNEAASTSSFYMARNGTLNFNADVTLENLNTSTPGAPGSFLLQMGPEGWVTTSVGQVNFGPGATLKLGAAGVANGTIDLQRINHSTTAFEMVLPTADFPIGGIGNSATTTQLRLRRSTFAGDATIGGPMLSFQTSAYQQKLTVICYNAGLSSGGNTVDGQATIEYRGTGDWFLANNLPDVFNSTVKFWNNGNGSTMILGNGASGTFFNVLEIENGGTTVGSHLCNFRIGGSGANMVFDNHVTLINRAEANRGINIATGTSDQLAFNADLFLHNRGDAAGASGFGHIRFGDGKTTISAASNVSLVNFPDGQLRLNNVEILGAGTLTFDMRAQNSGNGVAEIVLGRGSVFHRNIVARGPRIRFGGADFRGTTTATRTNGHTTGNQWQASKNRFRGDFFFTMEATDAPASAPLFYGFSNDGNTAGDTEGDTFEGNATFTITSASWAAGYRVRLANSHISRFAQNITIQFNAPSPNFEQLTGSNASGLRFTGTGTQMLSTDLDEIRIHVLEVRQQAASNILMTNKPIRVFRQIVFDKGKLQLQDHNLVIENSTSGSSVLVLSPNQGHVVTTGSGVVQRQSPNGQNVIFPVGSTATYQPVTVNNQNAATETYNVRLFSGAYLNYAAGTFAPSSAITAHFVGTSWVVQPASAAAQNAHLTVQWDLTNELPFFDRNRIGLVSFNTGVQKWACASATPPSGATVAGSTARRTENNVNSFGVFSVASLYADAGPGDMALCQLNSPLNAQPIFAPFSGSWEFVSVSMGVGSTPPATPAAPPAGFSFTDPTNANTTVNGLVADRAYRFRWVNNIATALTGSCNGNMSDDVIIRIGATTTTLTSGTLIWKGVTTDFFECNNWEVQGSSPLQYATPNADLDLVIPSTGLTVPGTFPILTGISGSAKSLNIQSGASLTINESATLTVAGNAAIASGATLVNHQSLNVQGDLQIAGTLENTNLTMPATTALATIGGATTLESTGTLTNGSIVALGGEVVNHVATAQATGQIRFTGTGAATVSGTQPLNWLNVEVNKGGSVALSQPLNIANELLLSNGILLTTTAAPVTIAADASASQGNAVSYVDGPIRKVFNTSAIGFVFPTGNGGKWARIAIGNLTDITNGDVFTAQYRNSNYGFNNRLGAGLFNVSRLEHWLLGRTGTADGRVTLYWENGPASEIDLVASDLRVVHFEGGTWKDEGRSSVTGGISAGSIASASVLTSFSPFTFGSGIPSNNPLPVELLSFEAQKAHTAEASVQLSWRTTNERTGEYFVLERSADGIGFREIATVQAIGRPGQQSYTFTDTRPLSGLAYYRLRYAHGEQPRYSRLVQLSTAGTAPAAAPDVMVFPNPVAHPHEWKVVLPEGQSLTLRLTDLAGRLLSERRAAAGSEGREMSITDLADLPSGVYLLQIPELGVSRKITIMKK